MQISKSLNFIFMMIIISILVISNVFADENNSTSDEASSLEVEEILVTANRTEQSISDVSQAVQALTGDDLQDLQITDFEQGSSPIPNHSSPSVTCSCSPPVILTIIGVSHARDSKVPKPKPSASEMFTVQSTAL